MASSSNSLSAIIAATVIWSSLLLSVQGGQQWGIHRENERLLLSFKERKGNASFECSPSGPCVACQFSEKNDGKYRCSETGYRIPLKCVEIEDGLKEEKSNKVQKSRSTLEADTQFNSYVRPNAHTMLQDAKKLTTSVRHLKWRKLLDASTTVEGGKLNYITYRSCIPAVIEENLTVVGFEGIMACLLLVSGPVVYFRKKFTATMSGVGAVRIPTNSRF